MTNAICTPAGSGSPPRFGGHDFKVPVFRLTVRVKIFPARVLETLVCWQRRWETRQRIRELDDRMLRDVGLTRNDLEAETRKHFWTA